MVTRRPFTLPLPLLVPLPGPSLPSLLLMLLLGSAACTSASNDLSRQLLTPPPGWLAEPSDFGLAAEPFEIRLHSEASLTGFFLPHPEAAGRTVVLFHDAGTNVSAVHPYYRFLHDAGFQVLVFDPRGYGKSLGTPTLQAWLYDLPQLFAWLWRRPDVDREAIVFVGTGLGSTAALWAARTQGHCRALVLEQLPSLRDMLREAMGDDDTALGAYTLGWAEFTGLPDEIEPEDNAKKVAVPALFVIGEREPARARSALLRAYEQYSGPRQLWVQRGTGIAPHGMLTHDGDYQRQIATFLQSALAGTPELLTTTSTKVANASDGQAWYELRITAGTAATEQTAIEAVALLADGSMHWAHGWLDGAVAAVRIKLPTAPQHVTAVRAFAVDEDRAELFRRRPSHLTRSGARIEPLLPRLEALRHGSLPASDATQLAADLRAAEAEEPFHERLAAELADVFALLGEALLASSDPAQQAQGTSWLQRAVTAAAAEPRLHVWPGPSATYGYPQEEAVARARRLLAAPPR